MYLSFKIYYMATQVTKEFIFDSAHRLMDYEGKCKNVHWHTYKVLVTIGTEELNSIGMVKDFWDMKFIKEWLDENWDHAYIARNDDEVYQELVKRGQRVFGMSWNPTAENMCNVLRKVVEEKLNDNEVIKEITVYETPTSFATKTS